MTLTWLRDVNGVSHACASRSFDRGATWAAPVDLGPAESAMVGAEPTSGVVVVATRDLLTGTGIVLHASSATDTTFAASAPTKLEKNANGNYIALFDTARILFTSAGVVVFAQPYDPEAGIAYTIESTTCAL